MLGSGEQPTFSLTKVSLALDGFCWWEGRVRLDYLCLPDGASWLTSRPSASRLPGPATPGVVRPGGRRRITLTSLPPSPSSPTHPPHPIPSIPPPTTQLVSTSLPPARNKSPSARPLARLPASSPLSSSPSSSLDSLTLAQDDDHKNRSSQQDCRRYGRLDHGRPRNGRWKFQKQLHPLAGLRRSRRPPPHRLRCASPFLADAIFPCLTQLKVCNSSADGQALYQESLVSSTSLFPSVPCPPVGITIRTFSYSLAASASSQTEAMSLQNSPRLLRSHQYVLSSPARPTRSSPTWPEYGHLGLPVWAHHHPVPHRHKYPLYAVN